MLSTLRGKMSKLSCQCGNTIRDNTSGLAYKASILKDSLCEPFSNLLVSELQSYVTAVEQGKVQEWLLTRGHKKEYIALKLDHGNTLYDYIFSQYLNFKKDVYECSVCGRLHVESKNDNQFVSYFPDSKNSNDILSS
jgi:hypothetical protein